jgi:hypothetical protein
MLTRGRPLPPVAGGKEDASADEKHPAAQRLEDDIVKAGRKGMDGAISIVWTLIVSRDWGA